MRLPAKNFYNQTEVSIIELKERIKYVLSILKGRAKTMKLSEKPEAYDYKNRPSYQEDLMISYYEVEEMLYADILDGTTRMG